MYDTIQQDSDAEKFENLDIESKMENLIFTDFSSTKRKSEYSENRNESNYIGDNSEITNYESFPSSTNSLVEQVSNSVNENNGKRNSEFQNPSFLEKLSSTFSYFSTKKSASNFTKISTIEIENKNGVEMKDNESENGRQNRSILGGKYNDKMKKFREDYENKLYDYIIGKKNQKINNLNLINVRKKSNNDLLDENINNNNDSNDNNDNSNNNDINSVDKSNEKVRIIHNLRVLDLNKNKLDAISRFALHCKIQKPYGENIILCLPQYFEKYKKLIVSLMIVFFSLIILLTIVMIVSESIIQDSEDVPDNWNKFSPKFL